VNEPKVAYNESCKKPTIIQRGYIETPASDDKSLREMGRNAKSSFYRRITRGANGTR